MQPPRVESADESQPEQFDLRKLKPSQRRVKQVVDADGLYRVRPPRKKIRRKVPPGAVKRPGKRDADVARKIRAKKDEEQKAIRRFSLYNKRYKLIEQIGEGGMGTVFRARDTLLDLDVAIKLLAEGLRSNEGARERFKAEAVTVMSLSHEHIVKLHNIDVMQKRWFLVMEFVDGGTLADVLEGNTRLTAHSVVSISHYASRALTYAHRQGVIHRDLKPANIMLTREGILKIVDFGTALWLSGRDRESERGQIEGTPCYMSPEQIRGDTLDQRTDIYSLALILYECLAGHPAFAHNADVEAVLSQDAPPLTEAPQAVADVIAGAIRKDREDRWATVREFHSALVKAAPPETVDA